MPERKAVDRQPGALPEIRTDGDSVIFEFAIAGVERESRLVLRCDPDGTVWASIGHPASH